MQRKFSQSLVVLALIVLVVASVSDAHKKFYSAPQYEQQQHERCVCDCGAPHHQPVLPNKPFYGSGGYAQPPPRPSGGYGNAGSYAVSGSYGAGGSQVSGGY